MPTTKKSSTKSAAQLKRPKRSRRFKKFRIKPAVHGPLAVAILVVLAVGFFAGISYGKEKPKMLFTQQALTGSFRPTTESGMYLLTFLGVKPHTLIFSDRPNRMVGSWTNTDFVTRWEKGGDSFTKDPPNAVLLSHSPVDGKEYSIVVELMNPAFNAYAGTLTYTAKILKDDEGSLMPSPDRYMDAFPEILRSPALFIDSGECDSNNFMGSSFMC